MWTYANDAVRADELDLGIRHGTLGITLGIRVNVAKVTNVSGLVGRSTMGLAVRVDYFRRRVSEVSNATLSGTARQSNGQPRPATPWRIGVLRPGQYSQ